MYWPILLQFYIGLSQCSTKWRFIDRVAFGAWTRDNLVRAVSHYDPDSTNFIVAVDATSPIGVRAIALPKAPMLTYRELPLRSLTVPNDEVGWLLNCAGY